MVPETDSTAAPVSVLDLSLQDWGEFFVVRTGISKVLSEKGWWATAWGSQGVWLGSARVPSFCMEERAVGNPPAWSAFRDAHALPIHELPRERRHSLDQLWILRLQIEITQTSEPSPALGLDHSLHPVFYLPSPGLARILLSPFMEKPPNPRYLTTLGIWASSSSPAPGVHALDLPLARSPLLLMAPLFSIH